MSSAKSTEIILIFATLFLTISCEKKSTPPILGATSIDGGTSTSIVAESYLLTDGGSPVMMMGICWSTSKNPTTADGKSIEKGLIGSFTSTLVPLQPNTLYYIRAYATNKEGTGYGQETTYTTGQSQINLSTNGIFYITPTTAVIGVNIKAEAGAQITAKGICWGTIPNPTINSLKTLDGTGVEAFESTLSGLTPQTTYYVRFYAETSAGIIYSDEYSFKTYYGSVTDIDKNLYFSVLIGNQEWLVDNLRVKTFNNGDLIGTTTPANLNIQFETNPEYQWAYNGEDGYVSMPYITNASVYGRLYTWYAVTDSRKICPMGWHVPDDSEWAVLIDYLSGELVASGKMKECLTFHWEDPNEGATNEVGFNALAAGYRDSTGSFLDLQRTGAWWSATSYSLTEAPLRTASFLNTFIIKSNYSKTTGCSVRCIKD